MARKRFITWDTFCEICSGPAALRVVTWGEATMRPVCTEEHGQKLIGQLEVEDAAVERIEKRDRERRAKARAERRDYE